jgi:hypothetical protein
MDVKTKLKEQSGAALVIALIMIIVLTLIGLASTFTSTFEISLSGNKRLSTDAFYLAETRSNTASRHIKEIDPIVTYTPINSDTDLSSDEKSTGLENEGLNRRAIIDPNSLTIFALPSGKPLNDITTVTIYHSKWAGGGGEGTQGQKADTFIIDTIGTDQIISASLLKSRCQVRQKLVVYSPTPEESQ